MTILVVLHFMIHWGWVKKVTRKILLKNYKAPALSLTESNLINGKGNND